MNDAVIAFIAFAVALVVVIYVARRPRRQDRDNATESSAIPGAVMAAI
jgi:hypothetical protein